MNPKEHWETIYTTKSPSEVSCFQRQPTLSLDFIREIAPDRRALIIDVGGGASTLVDSLLSLGYQQPMVLDIADQALAHSRARLGPRADDVQWLCGSVLDAPLPDRAFDVWHDRAVFHFLTDAEDRRQYVSQVRRALRPEGHVVIATFAEDGPTRCSGLQIARYSAPELEAEFGTQFRLIRTAREEHSTPSGSLQAFRYCLFRLDPDLAPQRP